MPTFTHAIEIQCEVSGFKAAQDHLDIEMAMGTRVATRHCLRLSRHRRPRPPGARSRPRWAAAAPPDPRATWPHQCQPRSIAR